MAAPAAPTAAASSRVALKLDGASTRRVIELPGLGFAIECPPVGPVCRAWLTPLNVFVLWILLSTSWKDKPLGASVRCIDGDPAVLYLGISKQLFSQCG